MYKYYIYIYIYQILFCKYKKIILKNLHRTFLFIPETRDAKVAERLKLINYFTYHVPTIQDIIYYLNVRAYNI